MMLGKKFLLSEPVQIAFIYPEKENSYH